MAVIALSADRIMDSRLIHDPTLWTLLRHCLSLVPYPVSVDPSRMVSVLGVGHPHGAGCAGAAIVMFSRKFEWMHWLRLRYTAGQQNNARKIID